MGLHNLDQTWTNPGLKWMADRQVQPTEPDKRHQQYTDVVILLLFFLSNTHIKYNIPPREEAIEKNMS